MQITDQSLNINDVTLQAPGLFSQLATDRLWPKAALHIDDFCDV